MSIRFDDRVALVTGAATGLGRAHALGLAARGARVVVNDLGTAQSGEGRSAAAAQVVVDEIIAEGGQAMASAADITNEAEVVAMVAQTVERWGRIDILVNNAGILRDKSFAKMEMADFRKVVDVHLIGSANVAHACWPHMRERQYGRIVFTSSSSGLYGNFGQSNYGAAKAAMIGLMNVLHIEGARDDIRVNVLAPTATTRMTEKLFPKGAAELLSPESITPGLLYLVSENAPSRVILCAGAGSFAVAKIHETKGITLIGDDLTPETVAQYFSRITDPTGQQELHEAFTQTRNFATRAAEARGLPLDWTS